MCESLLWGGGCRCFRFSSVWADPDYLAAVIVELPAQHRFDLEKSLTGFRRWALFGGQQFSRFLQVFRQLFDSVGGGESTAVAAKPARAAFLLGKLNPVVAFRICAPAKHAVVSTFETIHPQSWLHRVSARGTRPFRAERNRGLPSSVRTARCSL
jgi:hypothetical protein